MNRSEELDLTCPISLELLDDPICSPCCGRAFSRASLRSHFQTSSDCPICRAPLIDFNVETAPRNVNIAALVSRKDSQPTTSTSQSTQQHAGWGDVGEPMWNCDL
jgi:hypothetical protein